MRNSILICTVLLVSVSCSKKIENKFYANKITYQIYLTKPLAPFSGSYTYYDNGKTYVQAINNSTAETQFYFTAPSGLKIKLTAQITQFPSGDTPVVKIFVNQQLVAISDSTHTATYILN